ncbi:hypothetical protein, conserved in T. vivax [Trypanosoma vivax Y486]|uniref:Uncharacterized protein n=1 Tax=Trypanosoma vivax (strain Y486) TaxID=1055687 RepID=F9WLB0_TRYVY|nr:hypothetical protein, conserved in T. vivax [Trypanosoma vivax Y486]|eukprot:CCD18298.1 hypothetical protein, conserved in T. vivax [Trypanosoma vivax Y486]
MNTGMAGRGRQDQGVGDEPPFAQVHLEDVPRQRWTLYSIVGDVLLRGARPPEQVPLSECLVRVGCQAAGIDVDVRMDDVIREPELYIPDADMRRRVLNLSACQTYALVCKVVPQLERNGITSVLEWGGADESGVAKRAVRNALADDGLWNTTRCLLDAAFSAAKDADARERADRERAEWERFERERAEWERFERERAERLAIENKMLMELCMISVEKQNDFNRIESKRMERETDEWERAERNRAERERAERERFERERAEWEKAELERVQMVKMQWERDERERDERAIIKDEMHEEFFNIMMEKQSDFNRIESKRMEWERKRRERVERELQKELYIISMEKQNDFNLIKTGIKQVTVIEGLYSSVLNVTWSCVKSGVPDKPLGMEVRGGGNVSE